MRLRDPKENLQLFLTRRCQLRCRYCGLRKGRADMGLKTALLGADYLLRSRKENLVLEYYGGEPLLAFDVMAETTAHACRRAVRLGKEISFYTATNGLALDDRKLAWMAENRFFMELSMDGGRETHNSQRVGPGRGRDSFEAVRALIGKVRASGVDWGVLMTCHPSNACRLEADFELLLDLGVRSFDLNYAFAAEWTFPAQDAYFKGMLAAARRRREDIAGGKIRIGNLWPVAEPAVINGQLTVDTDGTIRHFNEWMFEAVPAGRASPLGFGNVHDKSDINDVYLGRFHSAYGILRMYEGAPRTRRLILNNIAAGYRFKRFFTSLRGWVDAGCAGRFALPPATPEWRLAGAAGPSPSSIMLE
ncbi:MAG: radical SAM protein [Elusimicrobiota bacterium]|jgi:MoaA/NifB/PqqE/SkfB family radical SAM enzyme